MTEKYTPHTVIDGNEHYVTDENGDVYAGEWQREKMDEKNDMITIGAHTDPMRGPNSPSRYTIDSLYKNLLLTGQTTHGIRSVYTDDVILPGQESVINEYI
jgi:hypothetical protein